VAGRVPFGDIHFGFRNAKWEAARARDLLLKGYFDLHGAYAQVFQGDRWLVLGYKGSGKSALSQHLRLRSGEDGSVVVRTLMLNELSFQEFASVIPEHLEWHSRYTKVWQLALWLQLVDMLREDRSSPTRIDPQVHSALAALESAGLLPAEDLPGAIRDYVHNTFDVPGLRSASLVSSGRMIALSKLVDQLTAVARRFVSRQRFVLVVDGTDEIFTGEPLMYEVLAALIEASSRLNDSFEDMQINAKIVILCRSDLFNRLPGANKNKVRGDCGVELNWFEEAKDVKNSALAALANLKARVTDDRIQSIFTDYLPRTIDHSGRQRQTYDLLLDHTRHTPRDLLQLLTYVGQAHKEKSPGPGAGLVGQDTVWKGIRRYSRNYFVGEIDDEVSGHLQVEERNAIVPILTTIGKERFLPDEFERVAERSFPGLNPTRLLEVLYDCSAIGHVREVENGYGKPFTRVLFKYRNPQSNLNLAEDLIVHVGWRTKLSIVAPAKRSNSERPDEPKRARRRTRGGHEQVDELEQGG
jgi:hypothetical protein